MSEWLVPVHKAHPVSRARLVAHIAFDQLWRSGLMTRDEAYRWLARTLRRRPSRAHIARCNYAECAKVTREASRLLRERAA